MLKQAHMLEYLCTSVGEFFFPSYCVGCRAPGTHLCGACGSALYSPPIKCLMCTRPAIGGICKTCGDKTHIARLDVYTKYAHPLARALVGNCKYHSAHALARPIAERMALLIPEHIENTVLLPIPLHKRKFRERGYNQSALIAKHIGNTLRIPVLETEVLMRSKYTPPQARTALRSERRAHMRHAFALTRPDMVAGKHIILVDDVVTSGATVREAARTLVRAAPASIRILAFAHG